MNDAEARFVTSNYELYRPLLKTKNKKVIGLMKDEIGGEIMKDIAVLRGKTYSYLTNNKDKEKKQMAKKSVS